MKHESVGLFLLLTSLAVFAGSFFLCSRYLKKFAYALTRVDEEQKRKKLAVLSFLFLLLFLFSFQWFFFLVMEKRKILLVLYGVSWIMLHLNFRFCLHFSKYGEITPPTVTVEKWVKFSCTAMATVNIVYTFLIPALMTEGTYKLMGSLAAVSFFIGAACSIHILLTKKSMFKNRLF